MAVLTKVVQLIYRRRQEVVIIAEHKIKAYVPRGMVW